MATNATFAHAIARGNMQRLFWAAVIVVPLNLVHILIFWTGSPMQGRPNAAQWANDLGWVHLLMAVLVSLLGLVARRQARREYPPWLPQVVSIATVLGGLFLASLVVAIDQLITTNITPFLIGTLLMGILFGLRPLHALVIYSLAFVAFFGGLSWAQHDPAQLLTNRLNGLTAVAVGLLLSVSYWRKNTENLLLRRKLDRRQRQLQGRQDELEILATRDALTGLFNRKEFMRLAEVELARSTRYGLAACMLVADIDFFKRVNDRFGHPVGDLVLKHVATLLQTAIRATDVVGRLGGEEFIILLPQTSLAEGLLLADKVRALVQNRPMPLAKPSAGQTRVELGISLGVVAVARGESFDVSGMYASADKALYRAKQNGRNRVEAATAQDRISQF